MVVVLTESGLHAEHVIALAPYGKHIVVEKPMALTLRGRRRDDPRLRRRRGVKLFVVKQNRFNVPVVKLREALEAGRFGKLVLGTVRVRWCRPQAYYDQDAWRGTWAIRRRRADQPGQPPRRPARVDDGRRRERRMR